MSGVRKHFWHDVSRWCGGVSRPWKYGFSGCMPAVVSSTDGSYSAGTREPERRRRWSRASKNARNVSRISSEVITRPSLWTRLAGPRARRRLQSHATRDTTGDPAGGDGRAEDETHQRAERTGCRVAHHEQVGHRGLEPPVQHRRAARLRD